jgi:hypothetical protein
VDVLAMRAEEGRARPRKSSGSCHEALIRRCPNGETLVREIGLIPIYREGKPGN